MQAEATGRNVILRAILGMEETTAARRFRDKAEGREECLRYFMSHLCTGDVSGVDFWLDHGFSANTLCDETNETPLHKVCFHDHIDAAALLLKRGADASAKNTSGITPLRYAQERNNVALVQLLEANLASGMRCSK